MNNELHFREALFKDTAEIVSLIADDPLGQTRESTKDLNCYHDAMKAIQSDPNNMILLALINEEIAATLQLTYIPNLTFKGGLRAQIEGVRTSKRHRGQGIGRSLIEYAVEQARERGCRMAQLTTNLERPDAIKFYEKLGFQATHVGFKLYF